MRANGYGYATLAECVENPAGNNRTGRSYTLAGPGRGSFSVFMTNRPRIDRRYTPPPSTRRKRAETGPAPVQKSSILSIHKSNPKKSPVAQKENALARGTSSEWLRRKSGGARPHKMPEGRPSFHKASRPKKSMEQETQGRRLSWWSFRSKAPQQNKENKGGRKNSSGVWNCFGAY